jgi:hypothetical protein
MGRRSNKFISPEWSAGGRGNGIMRLVEIGNHYINPDAIDLVGQDVGKINTCYVVLRNGKTLRFNMSPSDLNAKIWPSQKSQGS